jgi:hypothetical protein
VQGPGRTVADIHRRRSRSLISTPRSGF